MWAAFVVGSLLCRLREVFLPGTPVFISPQKPTFSNFNSILECKDTSERVLVAPWCSVSKQIACLDVCLILHEGQEVFLRIIFLHIIVSLE